MSKNIPIVLVLPFPAQGHVNPMMNLSRKLVEKGCKVIFVNTEFNHKQVMKSMGEEEKQLDDHDYDYDDGALKLASIPDGLESEEDRTNFNKLLETMLSTMPSMLEKLIKDICFNGDIISCMIVDFNMGWALDVGIKFGINGVIFWPASAAMFAMVYCIPKLIEDGIIDSNGHAATKKTFQLSPNMPMMDTETLVWSNALDPTNPRIVIDYLLLCLETTKLPKWWLCNTAHELEPGAFSFLPKLIPIGPLLNSNENKIARSIGQFWEEDFSCITWLDQQQYQSVVYVAFGSLALFDQNQYKEIALGLNLTNRPFLWVVREDSNFNNPNELIGSKGKIVKWAPQQKVLNHPSIACFITHCGWNSTLEGLSNGVPFLCWPYFCDQFFDKAFICDELKVGFGFEKDENGLVSSGEIKMKVDQLLGDEDIRSRSMELNEKLMRNIGQGGRSSENFNKFVMWLKG